MARNILLTLSVILVPAIVFGNEPNNIAEAEAAFAFAKAKSERLVGCHEGQCVPSIHAAELAFARARFNRGYAAPIVPAPPPAPLKAPKALPSAQVCPSGKCTCGCTETGECICKSTPTATIQIPAALSGQNCRIVNGQKVCTPVR